MRSAADPGKETKARRGQQEAVYQLPRLPLQKVPPPTKGQDDVQIPTTSTSASALSLSRPPRPSPRIVRQPDEGQSMATMLLRSFWPCLEPSAKDVEVMRRWYTMIEASLCHSPPDARCRFRWLDVDKHCPKPQEVLKKSKAPFSFQQFQQAWNYTDDKKMFKEWCEIFDDPTWPEYQWAERVFDRDRDKPARSPQGSPSSKTKPASRAQELARCHSFQSLWNRAGRSPSPLQRNASAEIVRSSSTAALPPGGPAAVSLKSTPKAAAAPSKKPSFSRFSVVFRRQDEVTKKVAAAPSPEY